MRALPTVTTPITLAASKSDPIRESLALGIQGFVATSHIHPASHHEVFKQISGFASLVADFGGIVYPGRDQGLRYLSQHWFCRHFLCELCESKLVRAVLTPRRSQRAVKFSDAMRFLRITLSLTAL